MHWLKRLHVNNPDKTDSFKSSFSSEVCCGPYRLWRWWPKRSGRQSQTRPSDPWWQSNCGEEASPPCIYTQAGHMRMHVHVLPCCWRVDIPQEFQLLLKDNKKNPTKLWWSTERQTFIRANPLTSDAGSVQSVGAGLLWDAGELHADVLRQV